MEIDPGYAQAWALLASGQYTLHRSFGRAGDGGQAALDRALALDPDLAEARALKAAMLANAGRHEEAAAEIAVALRLDPESYEVNWRAAYISYRQGRLAEAVPYFEKAAALIETDFTAPFMLVSCYTALGDGENARRVARIALERAEKAVAADRSNGTAMVTGVAALAALGEADRAKDWMRRALLIDPDNLHHALQLRLHARDLAGRPRSGARHAGAGPGAGRRLAGEACPHRPRSRRPARRSPLPGHGRRRRGAAGGGRNRPTERARRSLLRVEVLTRSRGRSIRSASVGSGILLSREGRGVGHVLLETGEA